MAQHRTRTVDPTIILGDDHFKFEGIRGSECPGCGESYLNGEDAFKLSEFRKVKDSIMEGKIAKSGNSYVVRLPIGIVRALGLEIGKQVQLSIKTPHEIIITI